MSNRYFNKPEVIKGTTKSTDADVWQIIIGGDRKRYFYAMSGEVANVGFDDFIPDDPQLTQGEKQLLNPRNELEDFRTKCLSLERQLEELKESHREVDELTHKKVTECDSLNAEIKEIKVRYYDLDSAYANLLGSQN